MFTPPPIVPTFCDAKRTCQPAPRSHHDTLKAKHSAGYLGLDIVTMGWVSNMMSSILLGLEQMHWVAWGKNYLTPVQRLKDLEIAEELGSEERTEADCLFYQGVLENTRSLAAICPQRQTQPQSSTACVSLHPTPWSPDRDSGTS